MYSGFKTNYGSSEPLKTLVMLCYVMLLWSLPFTTHRRRPGAEFGRTGKYFAFWITSFRKKSIFTPKISDDFVLVIDHDFWILSIFFKTFYVSAACYVVYDPFFTRKTPISKNNSLLKPSFTLFVISHASDKHYFSKYLGRRMHGPSLTSNFWGRPPGLRPCHHHY